MTNPTVPAEHWNELATGLGDVDEAGVSIHVGNHRRHRVNVVQRDDAWELSGRAATAADLALAGLSPFDLWRLNEHRTLTGYVIDTDGDLWVTALAPFAGLSAEEFGYLARLIAAEADRLEFRLTGGNVW